MLKVERKIRASRKDRQDAKKIIKLKVGSWTLKAKQGILASEARQSPEHC
jgi:hypothetical protein